ncbi:hypothetical protein ACJQWK_03160 [Exserohilum turcicum]
MSVDVKDKYPIGNIPHITFVPYLVPFSYLISFIGCFTTIELLHRRISRAGWRSWAQLAACSVSFGAVAIWSMYTAGNRSISLGHGEAEIQFYYSPTYSALAGVIAIVAVFLGLSTADKFYETGAAPLVRFSSLAVCGICVGGAAMAMHYLGNKSIANYSISVNKIYVGGAAAIAVVFSSVGFGFFFHWNKLWMNNIWRRILVSGFLALGVCGMHWTVVVGTVYEVRGYYRGPIVYARVDCILALSFSVFSFILCIVLGFSKQRQRKKEMTRAQEVVLAVSMFDSAGRLLVSKSGLMPCQTITQHFNQGVFDDDFNASHHVFQWIFRVTKNWASIKDVIPSMRRHLQSAGYIHEDAAGLNRCSSLLEYDGLKSSVMFRELFCVTADEIATSLDTGIENLGSLYEDVLVTGTFTTRKTWTGKRRSNSITAEDVSTSDSELGREKKVVFGKGQMLILTKKVDAAEVTRLQQLGYSFAGIEQVSEHIARSLEIPRDELENLVSRLDAFSERQYSVPKTGAYLASFLIQAKPGMKEMDVIVPRAAPGQLPMVELDDEQLDSEQMSTLAMFDGFTLDECLAQIDKSSEAEIEKDCFLKTFGHCIDQLLRECPEEALHHAVFSALPLDMVPGQPEVSQAKVYAFCGIKEIYVQSLQSLTLKTIPFSFLRTYLKTQPGCADHAILAQEINKEFGKLQRTHADAKLARNGCGFKWRWSKRDKSPTCNDRISNTDTGSDKDLLVYRYRLTGIRKVTSTYSWSGLIMASIEHLNNSGDGKEGTGTDARSLNAKVKARNLDQQTLADQLMFIITTLRGITARDSSANLLAWK